MAPAGSVATIPRGWTLGQRDGAPMPEREDYSLAHRAYYEAAGAV